MSETHKPFRPTEPSPNRKGTNVVSKHFLIGKSKAQVKRKSAVQRTTIKRQNTYDCANGGNLLIIVTPRLAEKTSVRKARFNKPSVKASGCNRKVYRNQCRKCDVSRETQIKCGAKLRLSELWQARAVTRERVCLRSPVWFGAFAEQFNTQQFACVLATQGGGGRAQNSELSDGRCVLIRAYGQRPAYRANSTEINKCL